MDSSDLLEPVLFMDSCQMVDFYGRMEAWLPTFHLGDVNLKNRMLIFNCSVKDSKKNDAESCLDSM